MLPEQINQADLLDILFADRNKSYGAYPLRKQYNKRLWTALAVTGSITALALAAYYSSGNEPFKGDTMKVNDSLIMVILPPEDPEPPAPPPPPPPPPPPQVMTRAYTAQYVIVQDVDSTEMPPVEELERSIVDVINRNGIDASDITAPPIDRNNGVTEIPKLSGDDDNKIWTSVEIQSAYPGGMSAWKRFLIKTTRYPDDALENGIQGTVVVMFIVDKEGNISNIEAISGPQELRTEAVRVISKSGKWTPAIQNGNHVKSYKTQPITFQLGE